MFGIGQFARLTQTTTRTLRHYDELGLLRPARVDQSTGYRFYSASQLPRLNRIVVLRDLGFTLDQIRRIVDEGIGVEQLRGMLRLRQAETRARIDDEAMRLARIEAQLRLIEREDSMAEYDIVIKSVPALRCAVASGPAAGFGPPNLRDRLAELYQVVYEALEDQGVKPVGPAFSYYEGDPDEGTLIAHAAIHIGDADCKATDDVAVVVVPGGERYASVVHHGPLEESASYYQALGAFIEAHGCTTDGHGRDVIVAYSNDRDQMTIEMQLRMVSA